MGRLFFCGLGDYAELFRKNEQITKNLGKGLDIYIYIYIYIIMIPEMLRICVKNGWFMDETDDMQCVWR